MGVFAVSSMLRWLRLMSGSFTRKFAIGMTVYLSCLEAAHIVFLHFWNSEIFVAISSLIAFVSGIIIGQKAS